MNGQTEEQAAPGGDTDPERDRIQKRTTNVLFRLFGDIRALNPALSDSARIQDNLRLLVDYAIQKKSNLDAAAAGERLLIDARVNRDDPAILKAMVDLSIKLVPADGEVTAETLRATRRAPSGAGGGGGGGFKGPVNRHLWFLWASALVFVVLAFIHAIVPDMQSLEPGDLQQQGGKWLFTYLALHHLVPFTYGGLGAVAYLMRVTGTHLHDRTFDPSRIPEHRNRLALGTLSGGMIVLFVDRPDGLDLSAAALGFIAGYSVDFLFQSVDRVMAAILPKVGIDTVSLELSKKRLTVVLKKLRDEAAATTDAAEKQRLEELIRILEG